MLSGGKKPNEQKRWRGLKTSRKEKSRFPVCWNGMRRLMNVSLPFFYPPLVVGGKGIKTQVTRLIIVLVFRRFSLCYNVFHFSSILCLVFCGIDCRSNCIFQTWWRSNWSLRRHDSSAFRYAAVERVSIHFKTRQGKYFFNQVRQFPHIHVIM